MLISFFCLSQDTKYYVNDVIAYQGTHYTKEDLDENQYYLLYEDTVLGDCGIEYVQTNVFYFNKKTHILSMYLTFDIITEMNYIVKHNNEKYVLVSPLIWTDYETKTMIQLEKIDKGCLTTVLFL